MVDEIDAAVIEVFDDLLHGISSRNYNAFGKYRVIVGCFVFVILYCLRFYRLTFFLIFYPQGF